MSQIKSYKKNIVVFGEAGTGKSSVINMLVGSKVAAVSDRAIGCTFSFDCYPYGEYNFYDTAGLSEGSKGTNSYMKSISNLVGLLKSLETGVNLLIYVAKKDRIRKTLEDNYKLFVKTICMNNVPVILVVTHCEFLANMNQWWTENKEHFDDYGMRFNDCVCVCAYKGEGINPALDSYIAVKYNESINNLHKSINSTAMPSGWRMKFNKWFGAIFKEIWNTFSIIIPWPKLPYWPELRNLLIDQGFGDREATEISNAIVKQNE